jgi:hypothetical protein
MNTNINMMFISTFILSQMSFLSRRVTNIKARVKEARADRPLSFRFFLRILPNVIGPTAQGSGPFPPQTEQLNQTTSGTSLH